MRAKVPALRGRDAWAGWLGIRGGDVLRPARSSRLLRSIALAHHRSRPSGPPLGSHGLPQHVPAPNPGTIVAGDSVRRDRGGEFTWKKK
jgi:hypothetical protein